MGKVKAQPVPGHQRTSLLHMVPENGPERLWKQWVALNGFVPSRLGSLHPRKVTVSLLNMSLVIYPTWPTLPPWRWIVSFTVNSAVSPIRSHGIRLLAAHGAVKRVSSTRMVPLLAVRKGFYDLVLCGQHRNL